MSGEPFERSIIERIEADGEIGADAAAALRSLYEKGQGPAAAVISVYIDRLDQQITTAYRIGGQIAAEESQA